MIIIILLTALFFSFCVHVYFLIKYVQIREQKHLRAFINTAISNVLISASLSIMALTKPDYIREIDVKMLIWLFSGAILLLMLFIKINIFRNIYRRAQLPEHYHYNFFGKKVLHGSVVKPQEIALFFITMPFFLFLGAYFIARMINLILYGTL